MNKYSTFFWDYSNFGHVFVSILLLILLVNFHNSLKFNLFGQYTEITPPRKFMISKYLSIYTKQAFILAAHQSVAPCLTVKPQIKTTSTLCPPSTARWHKYRSLLRVLLCMYIPRLRHVLVRPKQGPIIEVFTVNC